MKIVITVLKGSLKWLPTLLRLQRNVMLNEESTQSLNLLPLFLKVLC